jgi:Xaa-Pro aminopeptidase
MDSPLLIFSNTKRDSDLRYLVGTHVPDDMGVVAWPNRTVALANALEFNRLRKMSKLDELANWEVVRATLGSGEVNECDVLEQFLRGLGAERVRVKQNFPIHLADKLRCDGFAIEIVNFPILPQRLIKSDFEIGEIRAAIEVVKKTFARVIMVLSDSRVDSKNRLVFADEVLTAERLRAEIENFCHRLGAIAEDTIVACGTDTSDPHSVGSGPLKANEFILIDLFPYLKSSGYYADVSRTFIKGTPSREQIRLRDAVKMGHDMAIDMVRAGVAVEDLLGKVLSHFEGKGFRSDRAANPPHGMFHSLGHGFGLDIHEPPRIGNCDDILAQGMVITIEPGLYYQNIGGVRIEDDILVLDGSREILTDIPHDWIIE